MIQSHGFYMSGKRDDEIIQGYERLRLLALRMARMFHKNWLPSIEDLEQAAALAALETIAEAGETTTLMQACRIIRHHLRQQEYAYGKRQRQEGNTIRAINYDWPLEQFALPNGEFHDEVEAGRPAGTGEFSTWAARGLHCRMNEYEPEVQRPMQRHAQQWMILDKLLQNDPKLQKLLEDWQQSPHRNMTELTKFVHGPSYNWTVQVLQRNRRDAKKLESQLADFPLSNLTSQTR